MPQTRMFSNLAIARDSEDHKQRLWAELNCSGSMIRKKTSSERWRMYEPDSDLVSLDNDYLSSESMYVKREICKC